MSLGCRVAHMTTLSPGQPAPHWSAIDQHGQARSLSQYRGKWLLVYFYPKDDTPGCTIQACGIRDAFADFAGKVEVVGVSKDSDESHRAFTEKYKLPFPLLSDADRVIITAYEATAEGFGKRVSFLIDPKGTIAKIYTGIDCAAHAGRILADVSAMQSA